MKKVFLKELRLTNFKGIEDRSLKFGKKTNLFGANEVGKSTVYTAFNWLLTGKDEFDRKDYEIKNTVKKELNTQAHEVAAIFEVDGKETTLKRVYLEKWVKPKGESKKRFEGHKTEFWVDEVPCNLSEYESKVNEIIPAAIIKLISNPYFFNNLKWEDQRRGLIAIAGNISDEEVLDVVASPQKDYGELINELNAGRTLDEWKSKLQAKKGLLKKKAIEFPSRIDEAKRSLQRSEDWEGIKNQIAEANTEVNRLESLLSDASEALSKKQEGTMKKQNLRHEKETELSSLRQKIKTDIINQEANGQADIVPLQQEVDSLTNQVNNLKKTFSDQNENISGYRERIKKHDESIAKLRADWDLINAETFSSEDGNCPTCKQPLPAAEIESKKESLQAAFNADVLKRKQKKVDDSNQLKKEKAQFEENILRITNEGIAQEHIAAKVSALETAKENLAQRKAADSGKKTLNIPEEVEAAVAADPKAIALAKEISDLTTQITNEKNAVDSTPTDKLKEERTAATDLIRGLDLRLAVKSSNERIEKRIAELEAEERATAQEIADLEQQEFDIDTFTRAKMDILEKRVNSKFQLVRFRLFERLVNGGIDETCVCEYKGVPYPTLNTAGRLIAGLDVLQTLSNFYKIAAPVFCDCRESTSEIPANDLQIINLFVSPEDKTLRIEIEK